MGKETYAFQNLLRVCGVSVSDGESEGWPSLRGVVVGDAGLKPGRVRENGANKL